MMTRLFYGLGQVIRPHSLVSLALLGVALQSIGLGLANVTRELDSSLLWPLAISGLLLGWLLARSPLPGWLASMVTLSLGAEIIVVRIGHLGSTLTAVLQSLLSIFWAGLRWLWPLYSATATRATPEITPLLNSLTELWDGVGALLARLGDWLLAVASGELVFDPVAAALVWSLALWVVAVWASWATRRHARPILGVAPGGALMIASLSYAGGNASLALPLLGASLLLLATSEYTARKAHWETSGFSITSDIVPDLIKIVLPISLALVVIAALVPSIDQVVEFMQELINRNQNDPSPLAASLGLAPLPDSTTLSQEVQAPGLPRSHLLRSGPELEREVVMIVTIEDPRLDDIPLGLVEGASNQDPPAYRYYWRSLTYDRYTGRGWRTSVTEAVEYSAGETTQVVTGPVRRLVQQDVRMVEDLGGLLHVAGELVIVDQAYTLAARLPIIATDAALDIFGVTIGATTYSAKSQVPIISEELLRAAGNEYPEWIFNRYLNLPKEIPARVLTRARDLTATEPTPYDRARAIERYLRTFPYNLDIPAPPLERDVADYFLFDLQQGYCDYYASTMVVLARAAGLPARLAVGYASGTYDAVNTRYLVTAADAHSWVEIYFPTFGWVDFEPTAGLPAIERPSEISLPPIPAELDVALEPTMSESPSGPSRGDWRWRWFGLPIGFGLVLVLGSFGWLFIDRKLLERQNPNTTIMTLYRRLYHFGPRLAVPMRSSDTPYEFAASLAKRVTELAQGRRWEQLATPAVQEVRLLSDFFVRMRYSARAPNESDKNQAIQIWQQLRVLLWLGWAWQVIMYKKRIRPV